MDFNRPENIKRIGLVVHPVQDKAESTMTRFTRAAESHSIEVIDLNRNPDLLKSKPCEVLVSIGGDGTLLAAVRLAWPHDLPVWGINVGDLGYLTTSGIEEIEAGLNRLAKGEFTVETRAMIEAEILDGGKESRILAGLNDVVVHRQVPGGGLMLLEAELDGRFLATFESDGLIISTPTGSTGYNLAAGGSILSPALAGFIITPICAHSFSARSLIIDDSSKLVIRPSLKTPGEKAFATADGQEVAELENCPLRSGDSDATGCSILVRRSSRPARLIRFGDVYFSDVLRDKLGWAETASVVHRIKSE